MKAQCIVGLATAVALAAASPRAEVAAVEIPRAAVDHLALSPNYVPLRKVTMSPEDTARRRHKRHVAAPLDPPAKLPGTTGLANSNDIYYIVDITVGNQTVPVSIDTGSSDTWMVQQPLQCVDMAHFRHPVR
jgi:predicted aspartyl protease